MTPSKHATRTPSFAERAENMPFGKIVQCLTNCRNGCTKRCSGSSRGGGQRPSGRRLAHHSQMPPPPTAPPPTAPSGAAVVNGYFVGGYGDCIECGDGVEFAPTWPAWS